MKVGNIRGMNGINERSSGNFTQLKNTKVSCCGFLKSWAIYSIGEADPCSDKFTIKHLYKCTLIH